MGSNDTDETLISVVTPFYNTAPYLAHCIESVLAQTHRNLEYVLVDNQSTDGSAEIAAHYAASDDRVRVVRNTAFVGQVENYNGALTEVSDDSTWVKLVQADDFLLPGCLAAMLRVAHDHPSVGLVGSYYMKGDEVTGSGVRFEESMVPGRELCRRMLLTNCFPLGSPTSVMYRADIVRSRTPFYELGRHHEDTEAAYEILLGADFGFVHQVLTYLRVDDASTMARIQSFHGGVLDHLIVLERFGPMVLSEGDLAEAREREWSAYLGYLGNSRLARRSHEFWDFHREGLASIGRELPQREIDARALRAAATLVLNPLSTLTETWPYLRSLRGR